MIEADLEAVYTAAQNHALASGCSWADRVYPDIAPDDAEYPYVVVFHMGGGETNTRITPESSLVIGMKAVARTLQEAMTIAAEIAELFNDVERKGGIDGGEFWQITSISREQLLHMVEKTDGGSIYHHGNRYRWELERKA